MIVGSEVAKVTIHAAVALSGPVTYEVAHAVCVGIFTNRSPCRAYVRKASARRSANLVAKQQILVWSDCCVGAILPVTSLGDLLKD